MTDAPTWTDNFTHTGRCGHTITVTGGRAGPHACAENGLPVHPHLTAVRAYLDNAGITPETLRYAATHEALCRSWIFDLLMGLADTMETEDRPAPSDDGLPVREGRTCQSCGADNFIPAGFARVTPPKEGER